MQPTEAENFDYGQKIASCPRRGAITNYSFFAQVFCNLPENEGT